MRCQDGSPKESAFLGRVSLRFRWKKSLLPAGPKSFFHQWLIVYMELRFARVRHSALWSVSKPRTINRRARMFLSKSDGRARAWPRIPIRNRQVVPEPFRSRVSANNRVSSEGVSFNPFWNTLEIFRFNFFFYAYTVLKFVHIRYSKDLKDFSFIVVYE